MIIRKNTKAVNVGGVIIGGNAPISVQSMTNTDTRNAAATIEQILRLEEEGCEIVRVAVPDLQAAEALKDIKKNIHIPLVADIHFDYRLALCALDNGIDKLRINPGNIGDIERIKQVVSKASERKVPIRIGVNSGSLEKDILEKYNGVTPEGICESAIKHVKILESLDFGDIIISVKASGVPFSIQCYEKISSMVDYPLHVGITEAGTPFAGTVKSSVGIGAILSNGIGDTIRVSLTGDPVDEVKCAKEILKALELREFGIKFISCPTCGRTDIDLIGIAVAVENELKRFAEKKITVAVMGCAVNGPGEAKEADIGIAGGDGVGLIFKKGKILKKVPEKDLVKELIKEIEGM